MRSSRHEIVSPGVALIRFAARKPAARARCDTSKKIRAVLVSQLGCVSRARAATRRVPTTEGRAAHFARRPDDVPP
jgi:hypothetical protein